MPTTTAPPAYALGWGGAAQTTDDRDEGSGPLMRALQASLGGAAPARRPATDLPRTRESGSRAGNKLAGGCEGPRGAVAPPSLSSLRGGSWC